jgi:hypothetical protein
MPYGKIVMETGEEVLFEFEGPVVGPVSDEGVLVGLQERFDKVMEMVRQTAQSTHSALENMPKPSMPDQYELKFGLKLTAEAGVVFAKMGSEGTFEITLRWGPET